MSDESTPYTPPRQATLAECNAQHFASVRSRPGVKAKAELVRAQAEADAAKIRADAHATAEKIVKDVGGGELPQNPATSKAAPLVEGAPLGEFMKLSKKDLVELAVKAGLVVKGLAKEQLATSLHRAGVRLGEGEPEAETSQEGEGAPSEGDETPAA